MLPLQILKSDVNFWTKAILASRYQGFVERAWDYSRETFWAFQQTQFQDLYDHVRRETPYYRNRPDEYPRFQAGSNLLEWLSRLPLLYRPVLRAHNMEFWSNKRSLLRTEHRTSGSTGAPLRVTASANERVFTQAVVESWFRRLSGSRWPRTLVLNGFMSSPPESPVLFWRDPLRRQMFLNIYALSLRNRDKLIHLIRSFRPAMIYGYPSAVAELAHVLGDAFAAEAPHVVAVLTSEVLHNHWREEIQKKLAYRVHNLYGSQEGSHLILECDRGGWHIMPLIGIVEIVDDEGNPAPAGEIGRVVITGISKTSMPLIRYVIGDRALSTGYAACSCGLGWPTVGQVDGRSEDVALARDGRRIGMLADAIIRRNQIGIREAQLIQRHFDRFDCKLVLDTSNPPDKLLVEAGIKREMCKRLGYEAIIHFAYLNEIPRGSRGKFKAMIVDFDEKPAPAEIAKSGR